MKDDDELDELDERSEDLPEEEEEVDQTVDEDAVDPAQGKFDRLVAEGENKYKLSGMYRDWFLDYASYVILDRAVPHIEDGLKPVQRRILHAMQKVEDGHYHKVAGIVGDTMKYHPHGDASIKDALVGLGLIMLGVILWGIFVAMDARFDKEAGIASGRGEVKDQDKFRWSDLGKLFTNPRFIMISLLCVFFYCCIISFKKFGTSIVIPRFGMDIDNAKWVITMIPFFTVIFTPLFGALVDKVGKGTLWMIIGSALVLIAHLLLCFAPQGVPFWGYFSIAILGVGYSLVPSAMWPSVPKIVPDRNLGTAYSLIYWFQNMGMLLVPVFVGRIFKAREGVEAAVHAEFIFIGLGIAAILVAAMFRRSSASKPELGLDAPSKKQ